MVKNYQTLYSRFYNSNVQKIENKILICLRKQIFILIFIFLKQFRFYVKI